MLKLTVLIDSSTYLFSNLVLFNDLITNIILIRVTGLMASQQFAHKLLYFVRLLNIKTEVTDLDSSFKKKEVAELLP